MVILFVLAIPQLFHVNKGDSISVGNRFNGRLENGYLLPQAKTLIAFHGLVIT